MHENCNPSDCPVNIRVDGLVKEFDRYRDGSTKTHKEMFDRLSALEQTKSVIETRLDSIDAKLDKLVAWREVQDDKPNKLLDKLKENSVWMVLAALIGAALMKIWGLGA